MTIIQDIVNDSDIHRKGADFERLSEIFLKEEYGCTSIFKPANDLGIDRIGTLPDGSLVALQAKAWNGNVDRGAWHSFAGEIRKLNLTNQNISRAVMFATSKKSGKNAQSVIRELAGLVEVVQIYNDDLEARAHFWDIKVPKPLPRKALPHQKPAIAAVKAMGERGKLIMATGTGKTFIASASVKNFGGLTVIFVPNMELVRQFTKSLDIDIPGIKLLAVFSGTDVKGDFDDHVPIPSTTNPEVILKHAKQRGKRVIVCTYQSADKLAEALQNVEIELLVCDEAHRTVGLSKTKDRAFQIPLGDALKAKRRLFMTATPRIHTESNKQSAKKDAWILHSMDDEAVYGPELYRLTPGAAIELGILSPFEIRAGILRHSRAEYYLGNEHGMARALDIFEGTGIEVRNTDVFSAVFTCLSLDEQNIRRALGFCNSIQRAKMFAKLVNYLAKEHKHSIFAMTVSSESSYDERERARMLLANGLPGYDRVIVFHVDLFGEGIDIPALDSVVFMDSSKSTIRITQGIGRALRKDVTNPEKQALVLLPVLSPHDDVDEFIEKSSYAELAGFADALSDVGYQPEHRVIQVVEVGSLPDDKWENKEGLIKNRWLESEKEMVRGEFNSVLLRGNRSQVLRRVYLKLDEIDGKLITPENEVISYHSKITIKNSSDGRTKTISVHNLIYQGPGWAGQKYLTRQDVFEKCALLADTEILECPERVNAYTKIKIRNKYSGLTKDITVCRFLRYGGRWKNLAWSEDKLRLLLEKFSDTEMIEVETPIRKISKIKLKNKVDGRIKTITVSQLASMGSGWSRRNEKLTADRIQDMCRSYTDTALVGLPESFTQSSQAKLKIRNLKTLQEKEIRVSQFMRVGPCWGKTPKAWTRERVISTMNSTFVEISHWPDIINGSQQIEMICVNGHKTKRLIRNIKGQCRRCFYERNIPKNCAAPKKAINYYNID